MGRSNQTASTKFINVSNHPASKWSPKQLAAAGCPVVDIQFPNVPPSASSDEVANLANTVLLQVLEECGVHEAPTNFDELECCLPEDTTVLVQGEMTLAFHLVRLLTIAGATVVAATSERKVVETQLEDGTTKKEIIFDFVQFREY